MATLARTGRAAAALRQQAHRLIDTLPVSWGVAGTGGCVALAWPCLLGCRPAAQQGLAPAAWQAAQRQGYAVHRRIRPKELPPQQRNLPPRNREIMADTVRVVFPKDLDRESEVLPLADALREAEALGLDLVLVGPTASPPACRLVDYEKMAYEARKREKVAMRSARSAAKRTDPKEVRLGMAIAQGDMDLKLGQAARFLHEGIVVRLVVTFSGGRQAGPARETLLRSLKVLEGVGAVRDPRSLERPMMNRWAVQLVPVPPPEEEKPKPRAAEAKAAPASAVPAAA